MKNMKHGWVKHSSNLGKVQHAWLFHIVKLLNLYEQKTFTPLNYKEDLLKEFLKVKVLISISNSYERHNKPPQFRELY
jgi:hypothetical protein